MTVPPAVPTMRCRVCDADVPAAAFCGTCGAQLAAQRGDGRGRLRIGSYAAAPGEHVLRLAVVSSLFPHLPHRSRTPFRIALALLLFTLIIFGLLRWQAPLVALAVFGFPLVFALYLHEADVYRDIPVGSLATSATIGVVLGIGWALTTGTLIAELYDITLANHESHEHALIEGMAIPLGAAVLMLAPAVVMLLMHPATHESLDGFVIGAVGAIAFTAAGILTRIAPQFATGVTVSDRPASGLLVQAGIQGVTLPLFAAATGGLVGAALWLSRPKLIAASVIVTLVLYAGLGILEASPVLQGLHFGLHVVIAVIALLTVRIGLQAALLHEPHDPANPSGLVLCPHCDHVVPDMPFCPNCGVAGRAASRTSRAERRAAGGVANAEPRPGYAVPAGTYEAVPVRHTTHSWLLTTLGAGVGVTVAAGVTAAVLATPVIPAYVCPPDCGRPPLRDAVESNPRFVSEDGEFSVQYPGPGTAYKAIVNPDGVDLKFTAGDTGTMQLLGCLRGTAPRSRSPRH